MLVIFFKSLPKKYIKAILFILIKIKEEKFIENLQIHQLIGKKYEGY